MNDKLLMFTIAATVLVLGILIGTAISTDSVESSEECDAVEKMASELNEHGGRIYLMTEYGYHIKYEVAYPGYVSSNGLSIILGSTMIIPFHNIAFVSIND